jgi:hypothetical protein
MGESFHGRLLIQVGRASRGGVRNASQNAPTNQPTNQPTTQPTNQPTNSLKSTNTHSGTCSTWTRTRTRSGTRTTRRCTAPSSSSSGACMTPSSRCVCVLFLLWCLLLVLKQQSKPKIDVLRRGAWVLEKNGPVSPRLDGWPWDRSSSFRGKVAPRVCVARCALYESSTLANRTNKPNMKH